MGTTRVLPGDTVELEPGQDLMLQWRSTPNIERIEVFPVSVGNRGGKHVLYQPEASWGMMAVAPLSSCDIHGVAYIGGKQLKDDVFHVTVKGTNGLLHSFLGVSGSGIKRWAGDEMEVAQREPITFYWTAGENATHANLTGVGAVDAKSGKASVVITQGGDYELTVYDKDNNKDTQKIGVKMGTEVYDGYYSPDDQKAVENMIFTGGIALGGTEPSLLKAFWVEGPDGVSKISTQVEKGKSVTLKWKVSEEVNHIEIYNGRENIKDVEDEGDGEVEVEPANDTDYVITVFAKQTWGEQGYKFMRATVHVGVHGEGEAVSDHAGTGWNYKFEAEKEWEIWKSPEQPLGKWFKWEIELGLKIAGSVEVENSEDGTTLELGSKNGKEFALSLVSKWEETHGEEYKTPHLTPQGGGVEFEPVKYDRSKGRLSVMAFTTEFSAGNHLKGKFEVKGIDVPVPYKTENGEFNSVHFIEAEGTVFAPLTSLDFPVAKGIKVSEVTLGPYLKAKLWLDWVSVIGDAAKDAAEDAAEDALESAGELAGAEVALAAGAIAIAVAICAIYVMGIMEAAAMIELGKEAIEIPGDARRGFLDGLEGAGGAGGYWYNRGKATAERLMMERKAHLKGLPKNKDLSPEEFDQRFKNSVEKHKNDMKNESAINEVIAAARASLWKGWAAGNQDTFMSRNERARQNAWINVYGSAPKGSNEMKLFHDYDNHYTDQNDYSSEFRKKA